ncbi:HrpA-like RNA helicase [Yasminevirus sp. GU-2018]|uniref:RNA helicase n=1 Tax=Yasminevirus sp. GU-2018 TaxID=2420051 RepID=A0A5K0U7Z3_9VIRU|nr:HrpA-like RNA helicase [Yasminevirus sp. GU-2018]
MTTKFITDEFEETLRINVVYRTYPNLNKKHQDLLNTYLYGVVQMIASCFGFYSDKDNFIIKLTQNSYKDLRWLLTFLIPYVDQQRKPISEMKDLSELYTLRYDALSSSVRSTLHELNVEDVNMVAPKYVFSNIQYGRCIRDPTQNRSIVFDERHLQDNYYLLLNTIMTMRNKLYINWIDVLPYRLDNYQISDLFIATRDSVQNRTFKQVDPIIDYPVQKVRDSEQIDILNSKISGLSVEDIYNTISIDLYDSVVRYKWLLFDTSIMLSDGSSVVQPLIQTLSTLFMLDNVFNEVEWSSLTTMAQDRFIREWDIVMSVYEKGLEMGNSDLLINNGAIKTLVKSLVVFFDKKYSKIQSLAKEKKYVPLGRKEVYENVDDYDERMQDVTDEMILNTARSMEYVHIYDFILEAIQGIKQTWYALHMMAPDKKKLVGTNGFKRIQGDLFVTFKNIYNFCKSMVHEKRTGTKPTKGNAVFSKEYIRLPRTWAELTDRLRSLIIDRLNNVTQDWFNISNNVFFVMRMSNPTLDRRNPAVARQITENMTSIYRTIRENLAVILFESLITRGTLSYMVAETDLTNNAVYDMSNPTQKKNFVELMKKRRFYQGNPYGANSYYYLTEKPFNETGSYFIKLGESPEDVDYFKTCSTVKTAWYVFTAYHWIAQVGFCHRFINNRVNFVTGGTGAGKSTQVPKLYIYYLKAIDRVPDPTVVVTVPRTNVATNVSNFVSQELSVPFKEFDRVTKQEVKLRNSNFYIQFKYMKDEHVAEGAYPKIRFITDGSVIQDAKDPLLKNKKIVDDQYVYLKDSKYDVVIIDEAHEHNTNMDMILTLMRTAVYNNNKIRLVIMSATMDADEPTYRRFYRDVNDNRKYPLNQWIKKHKIDRVNTERRYHISPPDETTRFKIDEHYQPGAEPNSLVATIMNSPTSGDALLFQPGTREIAESVSLLNSPGVMPDDVIALPYHAQLPDHCRDFMDKIDKNLPSLRISKSQNIAEVSKSGLTKGDNYYSRCVVVATNIAEASISIETLRYVVETGLEKTMRFDFERRSNILTTNYITDASRLQRKGRVGRVAPGTVYYTYRKGQLANNSKQFNISVQDIHQSVMLELLRDPTDFPIFSELINAVISGINFPKIFQDSVAKQPDSQINFELDTDLQGNPVVRISRKDLLKVIEADYVRHLRENGVVVKTEKDKKQQSAIKDFIDSLLDTLNTHYLTDEGLYDYIGDNTQYDYYNTKPPKNSYFSGFDIEQLTDSSGEFYIVHPDELVIKRNINGEIVGADQYSVTTKKLSYDNFRQKMTSNKIIVFWETLLNSGFVGVRTVRDTSAYDNSKKILFRTKLGELLRYCAGYLTIFKDDSLIKMLFYGYGLSKTDAEFERVLSLVTMLNILSTDSISKKLTDLDAIETFMEKNGLDERARKQLEQKLRGQIRKCFGSPDRSGSPTTTVDSDIQLLDSISHFVDTLFSQGEFAVNLFKSKYLQKDKFNGENIVAIDKGVPLDSNKRASKVDKKDISKRNELLTNITNVHKNDIAKYLVSRATMIRNTGLNLETVLKFATDREDLRRTWNDALMDIKNVGDTKDVKLQDLRTVLKPYRDYVDELNIDILKALLLLSKPYGVKRKIKDATSSYSAVYNPHPDTISSLPPNSTFMDPHRYQGYILNISENLEYGTIGTILDVSIKDMNLLANIYNNREMRRKSSELMMTSKKKHLHYDDYIRRNYDTEYASDFTAPESSSKPPIDFRMYTIPEHIQAVSNLNATTDIVLRELREIQSSKVFGLIEGLNSEYMDYRRLLQQI